MEISVLSGSYETTYYPLINMMIDCDFFQGLRTLELCVDNLQPDFLYEHLQPVRADLMQVRPNWYQILFMVIPLELCVDNVQPDFLYEHLQPVRADLTQVRPNWYQILFMVIALELCVDNLQPDFLYEHL